MDYNSYKKDLKVACTIYKEDRNAWMTLGDIF